MRITIGHVLILVGVGAGAWTHFSSQSLDTKAILEKYTSVTSRMDSLLGYFKSGAQSEPLLSSEPKVESAPEIPIFEEKLPAAESVEVTAPSLNEKEPTVVIEAPVQKPVVKTRRSKKNRNKTNVDPLLGTMVSLTLSSGREVKGMLIERSAASYKIEMPGMGPFTYEASKVKSIKPAK